MVTVRSPWLPSRKNVEAPMGELTTSCSKERLRSIAELPTYPSYQGFLHSARHSLAVRVCPLWRRVGDKRSCAEGLNGKGGERYWKEVERCVPMSVRR